MVFERLAAQRLGGADEVVHAAGLFVLLEANGMVTVAVGLDARRPEAVVDVDGGEGDGLDRIIAGRAADACCSLRWRAATGRAAAARTAIAFISFSIVSMTSHPKESLPR